MRYHENTDPWTAKTRECFVNDIVYRMKFNVFYKINKIFHEFSYEVRFIFRFFDSWYIIKYLLTETSGKQYVLWTLDCRCFSRLRLGKHRQSWVHKTYCFPRSQSISVNYPRTKCRNLTIPT